MLGGITNRGKIPDLCPTALMSFPHANFSMENVASVWFLSGIALIGFALFSRRLSAARYRAPRRLLKIFQLMVTFLFFFYSTTFAISLLYAPDAAWFKFLTADAKASIVCREHFGVTLNIRSKTIFLQQHPTGKESHEREA